MCWRSWKRNTRLFSLSAWARVVSCSSAQYSSTIWMSLFGICFPRFRFDFGCVSPTLSASHIEVWHRDYSRACFLMLQHRQQCKSSFSMILELISYGSLLMLSISIISVMECMPCPLVLMAASVMDPHCIAAKSWLNNLPLLWLERLSQLFNDVSVLEGKRTHIFARTHTHTHPDRWTWDRQTWARGKRNASVISWTAELTSREGNTNAATVRTTAVACNILMHSEDRQICRLLLLWN